MLRRSLDHGTGARGRYMGIEEGTGKQIGGRRNENATMNVRSGEVAKQVKEKRWSGMGMWWQERCTR